MSNLRKVVTDNIKIFFNPNPFISFTILFKLTAWHSLLRKILSILPTRDVPNIRVSDPNIRVGDPKIRVSVPNIRVSDPNIRVSVDEKF